MDAGLVLFLPGPPPAEVLAATSFFSAHFMCTRLKRDRLCHRDRAAKAPPHAASNGCMTESRSHAESGGVVLRQSTAQLFSICRIQYDVAV